MAPLQTPAQLLPPESPVQLQEMLVVGTHPCPTCGPHCLLWLGSLPPAPHPAPVCAISWLLPLRVPLSPRNDEIFVFSFRLKTNFCPSILYSCSAHKTTLSLNLLIRGRIKNVD